MKAICDYYGKRRYLGIVAFLILTIHVVQAGNRHWMQREAAKVEVAKQPDVIDVIRAKYEARLADGRD